MKIITDFITNSSSSVFLVAFPKRVKTLQYIKEFITKDAHAKIIFKDAIDQNRKVKKIDLENKKVISRLTEELTYGYYDGVYRDLNLTEKEFAKEKGITIEKLRENRRWMDSYFDQDRLQKESRALVVAEQFAKDNHGQYLYVFHYGDEQGAIYAELEHDRVFYKLKHVRVSHH
jgi:hypothetical protein